MTHRPAPDLPTLAAHLRLAALGLLAELLAFLGAGRLAAAVRRRLGRDLAAYERFATGIVVLAALKTLPALPETAHGGRHPHGAPPGFAWAAGDAHAMRAMQRRLFPNTRNLKHRLARFDAVLDDLAAAAARIARAIARVPPGARLVAVAPPAVACAGALAPPPDGQDSS